MTSHGTSIVISCQETGGGAEINILNFQNMEHNYEGHLKIHVSSMHPKGETLQYYICRGDTLFQSPIKERDSNKKSNILSTGLLYYDTVDAISKSKFVEHTAFMNEKI